MWRHSSTDPSLSSRWQRGYSDVSSRSGRVLRRENRDLPMPLPLPYPHSPPLPLFLQLSRRDPIVRDAALYSGMRSRNYIVLRWPPPPPHLSGRGLVTVGPSLTPLLLLRRPPYPTEVIFKEEQGEGMEKWFLETQGKHSSSGAWWRGVARRGAVWILPWKWISERWGGSRCLWSGKIGEWSVLMGSTWLSICLSAHKSDKWKLWARIHGRVDSEEVNSKWLKGGFLA